MAIDQHAEARQKLEAAKAYGKRANDGNTRAKKGSALKTSPRGHKAKSAADGQARKGKGESWRRGAKGKKGGARYETDTASEAHSCLDPICVRDQRLREWVSTSSFGQSGSPTAPSQQGSLVGDTDGSPTLKGRHAVLAAGPLDFQAKLNMRWKTVERAVQTTQEVQGVLTPRENKTASGHQDHRDRKDAEDYAATLNDPPASSGSGSFKLRSSSTLAAQTDSQLVDDWSNPCTHQETLHADALQHDHSRIARTRPQVVYVVRRRCCHCLKRKKRRGAMQGQTCLNADKENELLSSSTGSTEPQADPDLAARVEGLKALVAARRRHAKVLELQLEEKLLLQEADILGEHIARSTKMLENFATLGTTLGPAVSLGLAGVSGNRDCSPTVPSKAADERPVATGTPGVVTLPLGAKPVGLEIIIPEVVAPLACESSPEKLEPEQLMAFKEHRPTELESHNEGHTCVPRAVVDEGSPAWAVESVSTDTLRETALAKDLPAAKGIPSDATSMSSPKDIMEPWTGAEAPGDYSLEPELLDLLEQDFPITSEDLVEDRALGEASTTDDDDLLFKELRRGAVARLGMAMGEETDEMAEEASGRVARFGRWGVELDELEECSDEVEEVLRAAVEKGDDMLPPEAVATPDLDGAVQSRFCQMAVSEEPKLAVEESAKEGGEALEKDTLAAAEDRICTSQVADGEADGPGVNNTFATDENELWDVKVQVLVEAGGDHVVVTIMEAAVPCQDPGTVADAIFPSGKEAVAAQYEVVGQDVGVDDEDSEASRVKSSGVVEGIPEAGKAAGDVEAEGDVVEGDTAVVFDITPVTGAVENREDVDVTDVVAKASGEGESVNGVTVDKERELVTKTLGEELGDGKMEQNYNASGTEVGQRNSVAGSTCQKTWSLDDGVCSHGFKAQEERGLSALDLATSLPQRPSGPAQDSNQRCVRQTFKSSPPDEVEDAIEDASKSSSAKMEVHLAENTAALATNDVTVEETHATVDDGFGSQVLQSPEKEQPGEVESLNSPLPALAPHPGGLVYKSSPREGPDATALNMLKACPLAETPDTGEDTVGQCTGELEEAKPTAQDASTVERTVDIEFGSLEERMMQQIAQLWEPTEGHVETGVWDAPCEHAFMLSDEDACQPGDCQAEMLDGQSDMWVGFVSSDLNYIGKFVEELMGYFLADLPDSVQPFGPVVPESCFLELQSAKPDCIREQSVFDRCIFEAVVDAVGAVYRRCNRVEGVTYAPFDRLPLPDERQWIDNVKRQVLRAAEQPAGVDVVDLLLTHDAWVLQQNLLSLEDELI
eukprot:evm.model.scf_12EXC.17 EVM.evm.TU.scf_12EXC.17   scf_12EXC:147502-154857(+)